MPMVLRRHRDGRSDELDGEAAHIHALPVAALAVDATGRVIDANTIATSLLRRDVRDVRGVCLAEVLGRDIMAAPGRPAVEVPLQVPMPAGPAVSVNGFASTGANGRLVVLLIPAGGRRGGAEVVTRVMPWLEVAQAGRALQPTAMCVVVGVIGLQSVNLSFSRSVGDHVLSAVRQRLVDLTPADAVVERISGTRFVVMMRADPAPNRFLSVARDVVRAPIETPLGRVVVGCAIGACAGDASSGLVLIDRADRNASNALRRGAGIIEWNDDPGAPAPAPARLSSTLVDAVAGGQITAHFQPVVEISSGRCVEIEAFARWKTDASTPLSAAAFIDAANDTGAIVELGAGVLRHALEVLGSIRSDRRHSDLRLSVNMSSREVADRGFISLITGELARAEIPPTAMQIEIIDGIDRDHVAIVKPNIALFRSIGVRVVLDGFGGETNSIAALRDLDVDAVKLHPAMIANITDDREAGIVRAVLELARQLDIEVIAKGVERHDQHEVLRRLGCRFAQGYFYGAPVAANLLHLEVGGPAFIGSGVPLPADEVGRQRRIRVLRELGALDPTLLDPFVARAQRRANAPIAALSVVEADRQYFPARRGIGDLIVPRESSICARTICSPEPLSIPDLVEAAKRDPAFDAAVALGIGAYAGAPVRLADGHAIGALCVVFPEPTAFVDELLTDLSDIADHVALRIEQRAHRLTVTG